MKLYILDLSGVTLKFLLHCFFIVCLVVIFLNRVEKFFLFSVCKFHAKDLRVWLPCSGSPISKALQYCRVGQNFPWWVTDSRVSSRKMWGNVKKQKLFHMVLLVGWILYKLAVCRRALMRNRCGTMTHKHTLVCAQKDPSLAWQSTQMLQSVESNVTFLCSLSSITEWHIDCISQHKTGKVFSLFLCDRILQPQRIQIPSCVQRILRSVPNNGS